MRKLFLLLSAQPAMLTLGAILLARSHSTVSDGILVLSALNIMLITFSAFLLITARKKGAPAFNQQLKGVRTAVLAGRALACLSIVGAVLACNEIFSVYGMPIPLTEGGEETRLDARFNPVFTIAQSLYIVALPIARLTNSVRLRWLLVLSIVVYAVFTGSRGPILYLMYIEFLVASTKTAIAIGALALILFTSKALLFDVGFLTYLNAALAFQVKMLNEYMIHFSDTRFYGYFSFYRPIASLFESNPFSLIDLQNNELAHSFKGLLVATGYVQPFLDFGMAGVIIFSTAIYAVSIYLIKSPGLYPTTRIVFVFAYLMMFYDNLFLQLFYLLSVLLALGNDVVSRLRLRTAA